MKCDFHVHTHYSYDSISKPEEIVKTALKKCIDCLAVTDHEQVRGALEIIECARGKPLLVIPGIEVKSQQGDIIGLNVKTIIPQGLTAQETIKRIREQGGFVIIPHPFSFFYPFKDNLKEFLGQIDAIEILNSALFAFENKKAIDFAKKYSFPFTAGSDAHCPASLGKSYLHIPGQNLSLEQILKAVKNKKVEIGGKEQEPFEKMVNHIKNNINKINFYARRKKKNV